MRWDIVTGEYPPQRGGVSDYTSQVAEALARRGDDVHVWAPPIPDTLSLYGPVIVHRLPDHFGPRTLVSLGRLAGVARAQRRWLVQYTPHSFGWKGMNVPFCLWLRARARTDSVWAMFHEVVYPFHRRQPVSHNAMAAVTRVTASLVVRASARIFVSIPAWEPWVRGLAPVKGRITWLPIPSSIPSSVAPHVVALTRKRFASEPDQQVLGHFGTFGAAVRELLMAVLPPLLAADSRRVAVLVGRGGDAFVSRLQGIDPRLSAQVSATGGLPPDAVAAHLAACDVLLQPYPDGVSSRRSSVMAGLALGLPIVTTHGFLTESIWEKSRAVVLAPAASPLEFVNRAETLLTATEERARLRRRAAKLYTERFALERVIEALAVA